jgi:hypothetical protein
MEDQWGTHPMIDFELQTLQLVTSPNLMENIPVACPQSTKIRT